MALIAVVGFFVALALVVKARRALRRGPALRAAAAVSVVVCCAGLFLAGVWHYGGTVPSGEQDSIPQCQSWYIAIENRSTDNSSPGQCKAAAQAAVVPSALLCIAAGLIVGLAVLLLLDRTRARNNAAIAQMTTSGPDS